MTQSLVGGFNLFSMSERKTTFVHNIVIRFPAQRKNILILINIHQVNHTVFLLLFFNVNLYMFYGFVCLIFPVNLHSATQSLIYIIFQKKKTQFGGFFNNKRIVSHL